MPPANVPERLEALGMQELGLQLRLLALGGAQIGHIAIRADKARYLTRGIADQFGHAMDHAMLPVGADDPIFERLWRDAASGALHAEPDLFAVVLMHHAEQEIEGG
jgi:hypothetical protein